MTSPGLSIGDLAERTGVNTSTLRMWETRHEFPVAYRLPSGHRRYDESTVAAVLDVVARRGRGIRLEVAIEEVLEAAARAAEPSSPSVYAALRRRHPGLPVQRLRKSTLLGLSWAIEDEFASVTPGASLFGAFQLARNFEAARDRWVEVTRPTTASYVFADFPETTDGRPVLVALEEDHPMRREWAVVADGSGVPVVLSAWELPGQSHVRDFDRIFETVWGFDPTAVRDAARVCASVAVAHGAPMAETVAEALAEAPTSTVADPRGMSSLFGRAVSYIDSGGR